MILVSGSFYAAAGVWDRFIGGTPDASGNDTLSGGETSTVFTDTVSGGTP